MKLPKFQRTIEIRLSGDPQAITQDRGINRKETCTRSPMVAKSFQIRMISRKVVVSCQVLSVDSMTMTQTKKKASSIQQRWVSLEQGMKFECLQMSDHYCKRQSHRWKGKNPSKVLKKSKKLIHGEHQKISRL